MTARYRVWCLSWEEEEEHGDDVGYNFTAEMKSTWVDAPSDDAVPATPRELPPFMIAKHAAISAFERQYLAHVLILADGSITRASEITGVDRANLRRLLIRNGLRPPGTKTVRGVKKLRVRTRGRKSREREPEVSGHARASMEESD